MTQLGGAFNINQGLPARKDPFKLPSWYIYYTVVVLQHNEALASP